VSTIIKPPSARAMDVAAVDLGSNSFHMIVARVDGPDIQVIDRLRESVRLAAGLDSDKRLRAEAAAKALACLQRFGQRLSGIPRAQVRAVGTNTMRRMRRGAEFLAAAEEALGHSIEIISGLEEARLVYGGVTRGMSDEHKRRLVVDIGGGSTELIIGEGAKPRLLESVAMGCVVHTQRFFDDGAITKAKFKKARIAARVELEFLERQYRRKGWDVAIGASGTVRGVWRVMMAQGWCENEITAEGLEKVVDLTVERGSIDKIDFEALREDRRPVFVGGLAVVAGVFDSLKLERMQTSDRALREGLVYDLLGRLAKSDVRDEAVQSLAKRYSVDLRHAADLERTALKILDQVAKPWDLDPPQHGLLLRWAARLHEIGLVITHNGYHKHGEYILQNCDLQGFSQTEQKLLAALVRLHRGKFAVGALDDVPAPSLETVRRLALVLRVTYLLHRSRVPGLKPPVKVSATKKSLDIEFTQKTWLARHPLTQAELEREQTLLAGIDVKLKIATA
jgi:exopolyphosphatase/guanosine-5'-triphosphate,3'-diphosphate pyrophosphatase